MTNLLRKAQQKLVGAKDELCFLFGNTSFMSKGAKEKWEKFGEYHAKNEEMSITAVYNTLANENNLAVKDVQDAIDAELMHDYLGHNENTKMIGALRKVEEIINRLKAKPTVSNNSANRNTL